MGFKGQGGDAYGDTGYRTGNVYGNLRPFYEKYLEGLNFTNPRAGAPDFKPQTPSTTTETKQSEDKKGKPTTDYKKFADYDFASQGGKGFGMKDIEYLTGQGANTGQLRALRDAAQMQGLNVGDRAMQLLQQGSQQTEGKFDDYDFVSQSRSPICKPWSLALLPSVPMSFRVAPCPRSALMSAKPKPLPPCEAKS